MKPTKNQPAQELKFEHSRYKHLSARNQAAMFRLAVALHVQASRAKK